MNGRGFLVYEVLLSLVLLGVVSSAVFSGQYMFTRRQESLIHRLTGLTLACSVLEGALQHKRIPSLPGYKVNIERTNFCTGYTQITVSVSRKGKQLVSLSSGGTNREVWFYTY